MSDTPIKNVLIMCLADPSGNPRPSRMIELCRAQGFTVDLVSYPTKGKLPIRKHFSLNYPSHNFFVKVIRKLIKIASVFLPFEAVSECLNGIRWGKAKILPDLLKEKYDLIILHDALLLPMAFSIKKSAKIILDAREYYPGEIGNNLLWKLLEAPERTRICNKYLKLCDGLMTVSPGLVRRYKDTFGVNMQLVRSTPNLYDTHPKPLVNNAVRMVHHGCANRDRKLENMIDMFAYLDDRFTLDFYLTGSEGYKEELIQYAAHQKNIRFFDPVPFHGILPMLENYDVGLCLFEPTGYNLQYSLPNKFFEFIQARLMLAIGPSPDMAELIQQYGCGIVSGDFKPETMAKTLNALTSDDILQKKNAADIAAKDLCYENESKKIIAMIDTILGTVQNGS